jgi:hypothetical protein
MTAFAICRPSRGPTSRTVTVDAPARLIFRLLAFPAFLPVRGIQRAAAAKDKPKLRISGITFFDGGGERLWEPDE